jgi:hypothetical protein
MGRATLDPNSRPTIIGVDRLAFITPIEVAVNATTHAMVVETAETAPTDISKVNPSYVLTRNGSGYITNIAQTIGATTYNKVITRDGSNYITAISVWS